MFGFHSQAEGAVLGVEDSGTFRKDVDNLLSHDEGMVVENSRNLDIVFRDGYFAVVKNFGKAKEP
jgi:hypothetical protein